MSCVAREDEQSVAGGIFQTCSQVCAYLVLIFLEFWGVYPASALRPCSFISSGKTLEQGTNFRMYGAAHVLYA